MAAAGRPHYAMTPATLRALRLRLGLSLPAMGRALAVHPMTVWKWERGYHAIPKLIDEELILRRLRPEAPRAQ